MENLEDWEYTHCDQVDFFKQNLEQLYILSKITEKAKPGIKFTFADL